MKNLLPLFILLFALGVSAQVKKTQNDSVAKNVALEELQRQKLVATEKRQKLLTTYTEDYVEVKKLTSEINEIDIKIRALISSGAKITLNDLPDDSMFLLKLLIIQNQRIIELLEQKKQ